MSKKLKCDCCGKIKEDTRLRINPYTQELKDKKVYQYLCDECYKESSNDI